MFDPFNRAPQAIEPTCHNATRDERLAEATSSATRNRRVDSGVENEALKCKISGAPLKVLQTSKYSSKVNGFGIHRAHVMIDERPKFPSKMTVKPRRNQRLARLRSRRDRPAGEQLH